MYWMISRVMNVVVIVADTGMHRFSVHISHAYSITVNIVGQQYMDVVKEKIISLSLKKHNIMLSYSIIIIIDMSYIVFVYLVHNEIYSVEHTYIIHQKYKNISNNSLLKI